LSLQTFINIKAEASRFAGETAQGVCTVERFLLIAYISIKAEASRFAGETAQGVCTVERFLLIAFAIGIVI